MVFVRMSRGTDMDLRLVIWLILLPSLKCSSGQLLVCPEGQWQCDDGHCITAAWRCDGEGDCLDGSDEMGCTASTDSDCPPGQFPCLDSVGCVDVSARCDGQNQCPTGSDEENCPATEGCLDSEWMCGNRICIPKELRCNGQNDCMDNSDEDKCGKCSEDGLRCPDGKCLSAEERCDGWLQCSDGSDEPITCGRICSSYNGGCSHVCADESWGVRCVCPVGYKLSPNGAVCEDLDECASPFPPCAHYCTNTIGSYYCRCREGFKLNGDATCQALGNTTQLLMVQKNTLGLLNVKSQQFSAIKTSVFDPVVLTYDITSGWYYWADDGGSIYKTNGRNSWRTFTGEAGIKGLACDWLNGYLFWTNQKTESICMQSTDGKSFTTLLNKYVSPSELVLLPNESLMFWINEGPGDRVTLEKSWMDGLDRNTLTVLTAQFAHSLTADVPARRLYWISDSKRSVETVKADGTGRYSFTGLFNKRPGFRLAVFESMFFWTDEKGLWQVPQNQAYPRKFIRKTDLPLLSVYHELQQPKGSSACAKTPCLLCQLTKNNPAGFTCACPYFKVLLPDGTCKYPRFLYGSVTTISLLEFRGKESSETELFSSDEGILSFDVDWHREWLYWANRTGHVQRTSLTLDRTEFISTPLPVCLLSVDQRSGNLFWVSCDQNIIGTSAASSNYPQQLYRTTKEIDSFYLDWLRGGMFWLEEGWIFSMGIMGEKAKELLQMAGGVSGNIAFDLRASSLLWNSKRSGLTTLSLLKEKSHQAGRRWNISGSVVAAFEPFLLSISNNVITLWDRRDGNKIQSVSVKGPVLSVITALGDIQKVPDTPVCTAPSWLCRDSSVCLQQNLLCDGKRDCPDGDDEEFCVSACPKEDFMCKDRRNCIPKILLCDGRAHCHDGSDEVDCPTVVAPVLQTNVLKCRSGSMLCKDGTECILYSHVCDGEADCKDGSDELGCDAAQEPSSSTKPNEKLPVTTPPALTLSACLSPSSLCPSSTAYICISQSQFCDGLKDCPDGFDEENCVESCPSRSDFLCKDHRSCVSKSLVCDGHTHCLDGSDEVDCSNVAQSAAQNRVKCRLGSKPCRDGILCVLVSHVCDGERDCRDGSDEEGCDTPGIPATIPPTTPPCTSPSFLCPGSSICIKPTQMCDRRRDCPDGSDEKCVKRCSSDTDFRCKDRQSCIPLSQVCDGRSQCSDGSDEVNCPSVAPPAAPNKVLKCRFGSKPCRDGLRCILLSHICDGEKDCQDGSDEEGCEDAPSGAVENKSFNESPAPTKEVTRPSTKPPCTSPSVLCPGSLICIKPTQMCDGRRDCPDGSDEKCVKRCSSYSDFRCKDRRWCIPKIQVCDGRSQCNDGSDEVNCLSAVAPATPTDVLKCRFGSRHCRDRTACVLLRNICDGERDCPDGSDEEGCESTESAPSTSMVNDLLSKSQAPTPGTRPPTKPPCTSPSVLCPGSSVCIQQTQMCDGKRDCPDGYDEKCVERCPSESDFLCKDLRSCVPQSQVCDGRSHCSDGSDEVNCQSAAPPAAPTKVLKCHLGSKLCGDGTSCVLLSHICDGETDCQDGSDEEGCDLREGVSPASLDESLNQSPTPTEDVTRPPTMPPCTSPSVLCPGSSICIKSSQMCDGQRDCPDGSDEKCVRRCPSITDFRCKDRRSCVPKSQVCDGRSHCNDGSDELNCQAIEPPPAQTNTLKCRMGSRMCRDGTECVLLSHICDGETDCQDGSDEEGCDLREGVSPASLDESLNQSPTPTEDVTRPPTMPPCTSPSVLCPGSSICIKSSQMCDGQRDCPDGSDEKCVKRCPSDSDFLCKDRRSCVQQSQVCDGRSQCNDGSDEVNCPNAEAAPETPSNVLKCRFGSRPCRDGMRCILLSHVCDGEADCQDGSDEEGCETDGHVSVEKEYMNESPEPVKPFSQPTTSPPCTSPSLLCPDSSICIKSTQICDGRRDCPDGSDEKCVRRCPSITDFRCKDRRSCVPKSQVCDGRSHCNDGSDELNCQAIEPPPAQTNTLKCRMGSRMCRDGTECVLLSHICDGETDCQDGSDEEGCDFAEAGSPASLDDESLSQSPTTTKKVTKPPCTSPSILCPGSSLCIKPTQMCDGTRDCPDGFDEKCVKRCPSDTDFRCNDHRSCVPKSQVCDGRSQCNDGSDEVNCPNAEAAPETPSNVLKCRFGSRPCRDGMRCILLSHVCDGEADCQDGSDEEGCETDAQVSVEKEYMNESPEPVKPFSQPTTSPPCTSPSLLCPDSSICIKSTQICDGRRDCPDGSDEKCVRRCPSITDFRCKDRRSCVPKSQVCDGRSQCNDGSDELNCQAKEPPPAQTNTLKCRMGSRMCRDGTECVLFSHVCDGETDCRDGSDEEGCDVAETTDESSSPNKSFCSFPSVLCPDSNVCINPSQLCDGIRDCPDGSDENCVKKCADKTDFLCKDRRSCVSRSLVCDGRSHCYDGSDEADCPTGTAPPFQPNILKCRMGSRPCNDGKECVLFSHVCDGELDCMDGSDEEGCQETCKDGEFQCAHGKMCIPETEVCDGKPQCQDQSDEVDCWERTKSCEHRCADGKRCIPKKFLCDGEPDCLDGTDEQNCDPAPTYFPIVTSACITPSVMCPGSSRCISQYQLCDGQRDCPDGFDEMECIVQCENPEDFLCRDQRKCIPKTRVCDGRANCPDGSDEKRCQSERPATSSLNTPNTRPGPLKCRTGFKMCKNGLECIMYSHVCDGERDCLDGSDEEGCEKRCKPGQFQCSHGSKCIQQEQVCDGQNDCQDRSDEMDCSKPSEGCHHLCDNKTRCVPKTFLCDGEKDCADGSDEDKCGLVTCALDQYHCESGQCISEAFKCDGYPDCHDHSDEAGCVKAPRCPARLRCPHSHECLQKEWLCDGEEDCKDGSDEKNCDNPPTKCRKYQFQCGDGRLCIPQSWRCDGKEDCDNGADEDKCTQRKCPYHLYQCGSKECLDTRLVCNGITNCADGSDEGIGCAQHNCSGPSAPTCDHSCISTPYGPRCFCGAGFRLQSSSKSCVDIDECSSTPTTSCKQICQNARGSYNCLCHPGFYLEPDNKSCKTKDEPLLLASVQSEMLTLGVHSGTLQLLSSADRPVFTLDYHWAEQRIYWLSPDDQSIRWADVKTKNKGKLTKGVKSDSIAVDWVGKNLYWVDGLVGQILAIKLNRSMVKSQDYTVVLGENLEQPSSLVLIPERGLMLWSEIGSIPQIERSGMDGSQRKVLVSQDLSWPVSLAYDFLDDRVYWADEKLRCIGSASLDGDNIKILQLTETPSPFSVAVFNDRVFWSDTKRRTVRSADKKTGKHQKVLLKRPGQPFGLKLMHALSQPAVSSPCENVRCSHLCLLAPAATGKSRDVAPAESAAVCRCPKGLLLSQDGITCTLPKESSFIVLLSHNKMSQIYLRSMRRDGIPLKKMPNGRDFNLPGVTDAMSLDFSIAELSVFVAYVRHGSVDVLKFSNSRSKPDLVPAGQILNLEDDSVTALAVDWVTSSLYWSSMERPDIHVTSRLEGYATSLQQGPLIGVASITLHPSSGRLCYSAIVIMGSRSQTEINCAFMDGRNKVVLWKKSSIPISMVFANDGSRIYWADTGEGVIGSIGVDGSEYNEYKTGPHLLVSFTHIENLFLWVTQDKDVSKLWFSDGHQPKQLWFETKTRVMEIRSYNNETQSGSNLCTNANGGCVHLCLPYPGGRTCKCAWGFYGANDTSCVPLPSCPSGEKSCFDGSKCIRSNKFCDGSVDCPDQSDEQDCPGSDSASLGTNVGGGRSWQSPSLQPDTQNSIMPNKDLALCDLQRCNGHGSCITEGKVTRCQCLPGYKGKFCQDQQRQSHPAVILVSFCLVSAVVVAAFVFTKRKGWEHFRSRSADKENLMANMVLHGEQDSDSEELESAVDVTRPLRTFK